MWYTSKNHIYNQVGNVKVIATYEVYRLMHYTFLHLDDIKLIIFKDYIYTYIQGKEGGKLEIMATRRAQRQTSEEIEGLKSMFDELKHGQKWPEKEKIQSFDEQSYYKSPQQMATNPPNCPAGDLYSNKGIAQGPH